MAAEDIGDDTLFRLWREGARVFADLAAAAVRMADAAAARPREGESAWVRTRMLSDAWMRFLEALAVTAEARASASGASPFDPAGWLRAAGGGGMADLWRWLEGPEFADLFGEERRLIRETGEWARFAVALEQYRLVLAEGWLRAFRRFAERLAEAEPGAGEGDHRCAWDRLVALWRETADEELARVQGTEAYLAAQRDLLAAHLALRASLRARAERMAEFLGLPTRAEVDDLTEIVHAMGRELRRLRRRADAVDDAADGVR